ncbi:MAG: hypothetical protein ACPGNV_05200 [Mangrovicoccus sp.]
MNVLKRLTAAAMVALAVAPAFARDLVIAIPDTLAQPQKQEVTMDAVRLVLDVVGPGEEARFVNASTGHVVAHFTVPDDPRYANPRTKVTTNAQAMQGIKNFMESTGDDDTGQINIPATLNAIAAKLPARGDASLILIADPRSRDPLAPSLDMIAGAVPGDGHIAANLSRSPFGTVGASGALDGYDVYLALPSSTWAVSNAHAHGVERLWRLWVTERGGSFQMMSDDLHTVFALAGQKGTDQPVSAPLVPTGKLEMIQFQPDTGQALDLYAAPVIEEPAPAPLWSDARGVSVGISWDCATCDLDLYVRPNPAADVIYFGNAQTALGQLFKDHLSSPSLTNGYETVALNGAVNLSQMQVTVNHYGGAAQGPVTAELRIAIGDQVWAQSLQIRAARGNKGDGAHQALVERVQPNDAWALIDPLSVLDGS